MLSEQFESILQPIQMDSISDAAFAEMVWALFGDE
jgi:hypothetical protein